MEGLDSAIMRGFDPFQLVSTSLPTGVGRNGTGETSFNVSGSSVLGEKRQRISKFDVILSRLYRFGLVTIR